MNRNYAQHIIIMHMQAMPSLFNTHRKAVLYAEHINHSSYAVCRDSLQLDRLKGCNYHSLGASIFDSLLATVFIQYFMMLFFCCPKATNFNTKSTRTISKICTSRVSGRGNRIGPDCVAVCVSVCQHSHGGTPSCHVTK